MEEVTTNKGCEEIVTYWWLSEFHIIAAFEESWLMEGHMIIKVEDKSNIQI